MGISSSRGVATSIRQRVFAPGCRFRLGKLFALARPLAGEGARRAGEGQAAFVRSSLIRPSATFSREKNGRRLIRMDYKCLKP
jgi:hypothetical protein